MGSKADLPTVADKQLQYMKTLGEAYASNYSKWLEKQTPELIERVRLKSSQLKHGLGVHSPISCQGPAKCPFFASCPIPLNHAKPGPLSDYPINEACVLEVEYVSQQIYDYMVHLKVDPGDPVEMSLIQELALVDLLRNRAVLILSSGDKRGQGRDLLSFDESIVGFDGEGNPLTSVSTKVHPAVDIIDKTQKRRERILDKFNATRDSKAKNNVEATSRMQAEIQNLREFMVVAVQKGITIGERHELALDEYDEKIK